MDEKFMITGGFAVDGKLVTLYDYLAGFVRYMPRLNGRGRSSHGCGKFINNQQKIVSKKNISEIEFTVYVTFTIEFII